MSKETPRKMSKEMSKKMSPKMSKEISKEMSPKMLKEIRYTIKETFSKDVSKCRQFFCKVEPIFVDLIVYIPGDGAKEKAFARLVYDTQNGNININSFSVNSETYPELKGTGKYLLCTGIELLYTKYIKLYKLDKPTVSLLRAEKKSGNNKNGNKLGEYYKNTYGFEYVIEQKGSMVVKFNTIKERCDTLGF